MVNRLLVLTIFLVGCSPKEKVEVEVIPPFQAGLINNKVVIVDNKEIGMGIVQKIFEYQIEGGVQWRFDDKRYIVVDYDWMVDILNWWDTIKFNFNVSYRSESFDCDNFAKFLNSVAGFTNQYDAEIMGGTIIVNQVYKFGGVPSGGSHMLNFFVTNKGTFIVEPQGKISTVVEVSKYPNVKYIREVRF